MSFGKVFSNNLENIFLNSNIAFYGIILILSDDRSKLKSLKSMITNGETGGLQRVRGKSIKLESCFNIALFSLFGTHLPSWSKPRPIAHRDLPQFFFHISFKIFSISLSYKQTMEIVCATFFISLRSVFRASTINHFSIVSMF